MHTSHHNRSEAHFQTALERLSAAEMDFAHFNAQRTSTTLDGAGIVRGSTPQFAFVLDAGRPTSSYYNRAVGRAGEVITTQALAELPAGIVAIETVPSALTPESTKLLLAHGFVPHCQLCYLACAPAGGPQRTLHVERLGLAEVDVFFDLLGCEGIEFTSERRAAKRGYYCTDRFQAYVARDAKGTAYGWATMFVGEEFVFFGNAYTLPAFRRFGAHRALLAARLAAAEELGVSVAYADVEHQSQSHSNCEQVGFHTLSVNTIWVREP
jgi:GNAT superfamily N-acetyltransferase